MKDFPLDALQNLPEKLRTQAMQTLGLAQKLVDVCNAAKLPEHVVLNAVLNTYSNAAVSYGRVAEAVGALRQIADSLQAIDPGATDLDQRPRTLN